MKARLLTVAVLLFFHISSIYAQTFSLDEMTEFNNSMSDREIMSLSGSQDHLLVVGRIKSTSQYVATLFKQEVDELTHSKDIDLNFSIIPTKIDTVQLENGITYLLLTNEVNEQQQLVGFFFGYDANGESNVGIIATYDIPFELSDLHSFFVSQGTNIILLENETEYFIVEFSNSNFSYLAMDRADTNSSLLVFPSRLSQTLMIREIGNSDIIFSTISIGQQGISLDERILYSNHRLIGDGFFYQAFEHLVYDFTELSYRKIVINPDNQILIEDIQADNLIGLSFTGNDFALLTRSSIDDYFNFQYIIIDALSNFVLLESDGKLFRFNLESQEIEQSWSIPQDSLLSAFITLDLGTMFAYSQMDTIHFGFFDSEGDGSMIEIDVGEIITESNRIPIRDQIDRFNYYSREYLAVFDRLSFVNIASTSKKIYMLINNNISKIIEVMEQ